MSMYRVSSLISAKSCKQYARWCVLGFVKLSQLTNLIFLTSFSHLREMGLKPWSPLIRVSTHALRFCLCSTSLACRVCVLAFQGLGVDYSVMMEPRVLNTKVSNCFCLSYPK